ncbi:hypothetical protein GGQ88_000229 [Novosphingobium hassiacum]|uniref:Peptidase C39-like domain-containing protein n=1 Tax=Novosphingobium hassiacum TaxID=173676 RepID=A0A7W5ZV48_9SPHN|nr:hypothetical protein [Novosphingobium hassiacum]MBB3858989.1 hypothetical protein [Novosphingobium hassiacum]
MAPNVEKIVFPEKAFPLQQGAVDSLCAVYSVLNGMNALGELQSQADACDCFRRVVPEFNRPAQAILDGFNPGGDRYSDIHWLGRALAGREFLSRPMHVTSVNELKDLLVSSKAGGVIYFRAREDHSLTHYTYVKPRRLDGAFPLWDSCGCDLLLLSLDGAFIDGQPIEVTHFWAANRKD